MPTLTEKALAIRARQEKANAPDNADWARDGGTEVQVQKPTDAASEPTLALQTCRWFTPIEDAIVAHVSEGPANHMTLIKIGVTAGASTSEARAAIRQLQSIGLIGHNLTTGYALSCFLENI